MPHPADSVELTTPPTRLAPADWAGILVVLILAAIVFEPWAAASLPLPDFGTFLPLLDTSDSVWSQMAAVTGFYMNEGRLAIFPYALIVFAGNAFGVWAPGWYWTYFALNAAVIVLGSIVMRRAGVSSAATLLALAFWATMSAVNEAWLRPTGEPFALIFFLIAVRLAIGYQDAADWRRRGIFIALCAVGIMLSKELLVVLLPAGWIVSRLRFDGKSWAWAHWSHKDTYLAGVTAAAVIVTLLPIAAVVLSAPPGNYAGKFGDTASLRIALERLEMVLIPTKPALGQLRRIAADPTWILILVLPSVVWLRMIAAGAWRARRSIKWPVTVAAIWVALGIAAYLPWPDPQTYYMVPFAFGAMFGAAYAIDGILSSGRWSRIAAISISVALLCIASVESHTVVLRHRIRADLNSRMIDNIAAWRAPDMLVGAVPAVEGDQRWSWARHVDGFGRFAKNVRVVRSVDMTCDEARRALDSAVNVVVVSRGRGCGQLSPSSVAIDVASYRSQWPYLWEKHKLFDRVFVTRGTASMPQRPQSSGRSAVRTVQAPL